MIDISVHELNKYYGSNHVIKGVSFEVYSGEKVGLLGKNGSGKTTLFKVITEDEPHDSGNVTRASGKKVEILAQIPVYNEDDTVEDVLRSSFKEATEIHDAMKKIEGDPAALMKYGRLMEEYERLGGYDIETKIEKICNGMNISEGMRGSRFQLLSGGEKTRVNLAHILLRDCDMLLLDEPTNHLDLASLAWLEHFIREFSGTVVVISHDRAFLDNVVSRIIELEDGKANFYTGNYSFYVEEKERRYLTQAEQYKQQQRKIEQLETAIKRQRVWADINPSNTGLAKRALAMEKRIEQMDKVERPATSKKMTEDFNSAGHVAKVVVSIDSVYKSYGNNVLMHDIRLTVDRKDCIALIGANGCGKTTLLNMIMGRESPDSGIVKVSSNVKIGYMPQIIVFDDENATVLDTLRNAVGFPEEKLRSILARFRFRAADVIKKVDTLSGGEKSRLKLCLLMQSQINFLILDEPTNHLDIESREWIEEAVSAVSDWECTLLFISHDRYFLNKFASKVWSMKDGTISQFIGGFEDYLTANAAAPKPPDASARQDKKKKKAPAKAKEPVKPPVPVETRIYEAETELEQLEAEIALHLSHADYDKMDGLYQKKREIEAHIAGLYEEWDG
ncbi:MAG: ABC-F family ATP-binding cassette domain-containing protein [Defluviitaleaceae bacterium]|nr:ABC-F family ATP-binding cassette domain-containing protein [Defluviitaleaceae bacterium]